MTFLHHLPSLQAQSSPGTTETPDSAALPPVSFGGVNDRVDAVTSRAQTDEEEVHTPQGSRASSVGSVFFVGPPLPSLRVSPWPWPLVPSTKFWQV